MSNELHGEGPRITKDLPFSRMNDIGPIGVYESQVNNWIFSPAQLLAGQHNIDPDHGMALLIIILTFFEPHGVYLDGTNGLRKSKRKSDDAAIEELETTGNHFKIGFKAFLDWLALKKSKHIAHPDVAEIYKWMRCGLFHMSHLSPSIMIGVGPSNQIFIRHPRYANGWLVSPWIMFLELEAYFRSYIDRLRAGEEPFISNFTEGYKFLFEGPTNAIMKATR